MELIERNIVSQNLDFFLEIAQVQKGKTRLDRGACEFLLKCICGAGVLVDCKTHMRQCFEVCAQKANRVFDYINRSIVYGSRKALILHILSFFAGQGTSGGCVWFWVLHFKRE